jgi:hypothetical protein
LRTCPYWNEPRVAGLKSSIWTRCEPNYREVAFSQTTRGNHPISRHRKSDLARSHPRQIRTRCPSFPLCFYTEPENELFSKHDVHIQFYFDRKAILGGSWSRWPASTYSPNDHLHNCIPQLGGVHVVHTQSRWDGSSVHLRQCAFPWLMELLFQEDVGQPCRKSMLSL